MQPDQQNPAPQSNSNIPDYLHLDPIPDPTQRARKKKKLAIIVVSVVVLLLLGAGGIWAWLWVQGEPERRFYQALDNMMQTRYVSREMKIADQDLGMSLSVTSESDFSDPAEPKSKLNYVYSLPRDGEAESTVEGERIILGTQGYFERFIQASGITIDPKMEFNQWYMFSRNITNSFDVMSLSSMVNIPIGLIAIGNFDTDHRTLLIDYMKTNNVYTINQSRTEILNGKETVVIAAALKDREARSFIEQAAKITGLQIDTFGDNFFKGITVSDVMFWIDKESERLAKMSFNTVFDDEKQPITTEITLQYPDSLSIEQPDGAKKRT